MVQSARQKDPQVRVYFYPLPEGMLTVAKVIAGRLFGPSVVN